MDLRIMERDPNSPTASLKQKLRSSLCLMPCFNSPKSHHHHQNGSVTAPTTPQGYNSGRRSSITSRDDFGLLRASSASLSSPKSTSSRHRRHHHHHHEFAELKGKCRSFIGRMGRMSSGRRHSAEFKYDQLSYALNFDHEEDNIDDGSFPLRNFSARLPLSPVNGSPAASPVAKEISACS